VACKDPVADEEKGGRHKYGEELRKVLPQSELLKSAGEKDWGLGSREREKMTSEPQVLMDAMDVLIIRIMILNFSHNYLLYVIIFLNVTIVRVCTIFFSETG